MKRFFLFAYLLLVVNLSAQNTLKGAGTVKFTSEAPLELIKAASSELIGAIDTLESQFAFSVDVASFEGFNSSLQKDHFKEHYLESDLFKTTTFSGKFIEKINWEIPATLNVRTKGVFNLHGVELEKIIPIILIIEENRIQVLADFDILLQDFNIKIPKIVYNKIAEKIDIEVQVTFE